MPLSTLIIFLSISFLGDIALSLIGAPSSRPLLIFKALAYGALFVIIAHVSLTMLLLLILMHLFVDIATSDIVTARYPERFRDAQYSLTINQVLKVLIIVVLLLVVH